MRIVPTHFAIPRPTRLLCAVITASFSLAAFAQGQQPGAPAPESVTLEQAIERALQQDPRIVQARGNTRVAAAGERSAFGSYLPSVSASAGTSVSNRDTVAGASAGISVGYDLFTGFRRRAETEQARSETATAAAGLLLDRASVALEVERTFYEGLRGRELEEVAQARLTRAEQGLDTAQRKAAAGTATRSDVLRAELELNTAKQDLLEARLTSQNAAYELGRAIGAEGPVTAADGGADAADAFDADRLVSELMQRSPDILAAEASVRSATAGVEVARSQYLPQVGISAGTGWGAYAVPPAGQLNPSFFPGGLSWNLGLNLSVPLFDGFRRDESLERARVQESVTTASLANTRRVVRTAAQQLLGQLRLARERITLQEKSVTVAQEDLRVQQERYRLGVTTMLELLASQTSVVQAQTELVGARFDYRLARAELQSLAGRPE